MGYSGSRKPRARLIDPYKLSLRERWQQGYHQEAQLERELRAKGYKGSQRAIYRYLETLEALSFSARKSGSASATKPLNPLLTLSAQQATWLFFRKLQDLKEEERENLRLLRQASPYLETAYQLVETFLHMIREHTGEQLDAWLAKVKASHLEAFESFVTGVQKDKDAVLAGLTLSWSNGPLEGHVNRLKLLKRSMYSRAEFDLLKLRVLHQSKQNQERKNKYKHNQGQQVGRLKKSRMMKNGTTSQGSYASSPIIDTETSLRERFLMPSAFIRKDLTPHRGEKQPLYRVQNHRGGKCHLPFRRLLHPGENPAIFLPSGKISHDAMRLRLPAGYPAEVRAANLLAVPLLWEQILAGVLLIYKHEWKGACTQEEIDLVRAVAAHALLLIECLSYLHKPGG